MFAATCLPSSARLIGLGSPETPTAAARATCSASVRPNVRSLRISAGRARSWQLALPRRPSKLYAPVFASSIEGRKFGGGGGSGRGDGRGGDGGGGGGGGGNDIKALRPDERERERHEAAPSGGSLVATHAVALASQRRKANFSAGLYTLVGVAFAGLSAVLAEIGVRSQVGYLPPGYPSPAGTILTMVGANAVWQTIMLSVMGGRAVCRSMGGRPIDPRTATGEEAALLRLVSETARAAGLKSAPPVYLIPANELNAFAAGLSPQSAAVGVTRGALRRFTPAELRAVLGHEMGHVNNGDMKAGTALAIVLAGFYGVSRFGLDLLTRPRYHPRYDERRREKEERPEDRIGRVGRKRARNVDPLTAVGLSLLAAGCVTWLAGTVLRNMVSREREYLADACGAQYTGRPLDLASALERIEREGKRGYSRDMPRAASPYAHLYFSASPRSLFDFVFATHPPVRKRIERLRAMAVAQGR